MCSLAIIVTIFRKFNGQFRSEWVQLTLEAFFESIPQSLLKV
jgi:hypothetical protein